jgi:hypothetical protein
MMTEWSNGARESENGWRGQWTLEGLRGSRAGKEARRCNDARARWGLGMGDGGVLEWGASKLQSPLQYSTHSSASSCVAELRGRGAWAVGRRETEREREVEEKVCVSCSLPFLLSCRLCVRAGL